MATALTNPYTVPTDQEVLDWATTAVVLILSTGQAYSIDGSRTLTRANLNDVRATVREYEVKVNVAEKRTSTNYARFLRPV